MRPIMPSKNCWGITIDIYGCNKDREDKFIIEYKVKETYMYLMKGL